MAAAVRGRSRGSVIRSRWPHVEIGGVLGANGNRGKSRYDSRKGRNCRSTIQNAGFRHKVEILLTKFGSRAGEPGTVFLDRPRADILHRTWLVVRVLA